MKYYYKEHVSFTISLLHQILFGINGDIKKNIYIHYKINNLYGNITFCLLKILKGYSMKIFLI